MTIPPPPRRYEPAAHMATTMRVIGLVAVVAAGVFALSALGEDRTEQFVIATLAVILVGLGLWSFVASGRIARYGFEHGPAGFRNTAPNAEWRPWSAVETVRVRRGEIVLLDERGKRLAGFSALLSGFQEALDDVMAACPQAVPDPVFPATFTSRTTTSGHIDYARGPAVLLLVTGVALVITQLLGSPALFSMAILALGIPAALIPTLVAAYRRRRTQVIGATVDATGITIRDRQGERRFEADHIRDVHVVWGDPDWRARRARGEGGSRPEPGYRVVVQDRDGTTVAITPPAVDVVALYAAVRAIRAL